MSSTLGELAEERVAVRGAIEQLRLIPVMFELGARAHPPRELYRSYLAQSQVFVGLYWERYGWVAPGESISGLEDEFLLSEGMPRLLYLKAPAPGREPRLEAMLRRVEEEGSASYRSFSDAEELRGLVLDDLVVLLSERFEAVAADVVEEESTGAVGEPAPSGPPVPMTRMVGRDTDVEQIVERFGEGTRLVTLTGPGGTGKTRLALECARELRDAEFEGVVFVALEAVIEPSKLLRTIRERLAIATTGTRPTLEVLVEALTGRRVLLVLDNFEQLVDAAPALAELLHRCPGVHALVTSRQILHLRGELEYPVDPLEPETAARLFVERATAARPGFELTDDNRPAVLGLCRRLDGLPLAIELAAARVRLFSPNALLERLEHRFDLLSGGASDLPQRQQTLRATLDWSYELLGPVEQRLLARLSVFVGGATLEAIEAVCQDDAVPDVIETLSSLMEKSLLVSDQDDTGQVRVRLLQTVRDYAHERLSDRNEVDTMRTRHAAWFVDLVEPGDLARHEHGLRHWPVMEADRDNLRAAGTWLLETRDLGQAATFALGVGPWAWQSGGLREFQDWIDQLVVYIDEDVPAGTHGVLRFMPAMTRLLLGNAEGAAELIDPAVDLLVEAGDRPVATYARIVRSAALFGLGRIEEAGPDAQAAVDTAYALENRWMLGWSCLLRGNHRQSTGDLAGARSDFTVALDTAERLGFDPLAVQAHTALAWVCLMEARPDDRSKLEEARRHLEDQLPTLQRTLSLENLSYALDAAAGLALAENRPQDAARALGTVRAIRQRPGIPSGPLQVWIHDAQVESVREQLGSATTTELMDHVGHLDPWAVGPLLLRTTAGNASHLSPEPT